MRTPPTDPPPAPQDVGRSATDVRQALPEGMRPRFDEALADATPGERAHVLALWRGIAIGAQDPTLDEQIRRIRQGTEPTHTWEEVQRMRPRQTGTP
ncbi:hypothetical protein ACFP1Z_10285 [Streptomyces gamaensis]|uniref:Antitoxin VbhA domain-containing protein n=1 Tax=Streptomyces gamaensis TaxID=1763542 RepID=A0ABW0YYR0_9ACTN